MAIVILTDWYHKTDKNGSKKRWVRVRCDCGSEHEAQLDNAKRTKSCKWCRSKTHGATSGKQAKVYKVWKGIKQRCLNEKSASWHKYGGRGITICERWAKSFEDFSQDMGERPDGGSIDRIDNSKGYEPENCRWATPKEQSRNTRRNRMLTINGETKCLAALCEQFGVKQSTAKERLNRGWTHKQAIFGKLKE